jgi:hypothetical protein
MRGIYGWDAASMEVNLQTVELISIQLFVIGIIIVGMGLVWFRLSIMTFGILIVFGAMYIGKEVAAELDHFRCASDTVKMIERNSGNIICYPAELAADLPLDPGDGGDPAGNRVVSFDWFRIPALAGKSVPASP